MGCSHFSGSIPFVAFQMATRGTPFELIKVIYKVVEILVAFLQSGAPAEVFGKSHRRSSLFYSLSASLFFC